MDFYLSVEGYLHGQDDVGDLYLKEALRQLHNAAEKEVTSNNIVAAAALSAELLAIEQRGKDEKRHHLTKNVLLFMTNFEASSEKTPSYIQIVGI